MSLTAGHVYRVRYGTKTSSSTQKKAERRVEVLRGPHDDSRFRLGQVVTVKDLSDPVNPGVEKTMYVSRFISSHYEVASLFFMLLRSHYCSSLLLPSRSQESSVDA